jgi:hypothetical protein
MPPPFAAMVIKSPYSYSMHAAPITRVKDYVDKVAPLMKQVQLLAKL